MYMYNNNAIITVFDERTDIMDLFMSSWTFNRNINIFLLCRRLAMYNCCIRTQLFDVYYRTCSFTS